MQKTVEEVLAMIRARRLKRDLTDLPFESATAAPGEMRNARRRDCGCDSCGCSR